MGQAALFLFLIFSLSVIQARGQEENIIGTSWKSESAFSITDGNYFDYKGEWKIYSDRIEWLQPGQKYKYIFHVKSLAGEWNGEALAGRISAEVVFREQTGTIDFYRNSDESYLKILIKTDVGELFPFRFKISAVGKS